MDASQGQTLDRYLSERGPLDPTQAMRLAIQLATQMGGKALIVHPGRVLLSPSGAAQLLPPPAEDMALPPILEFPAYSAPELVRGAALDARSALYSLGCTLFEALTGTPPYSGKDARDILRAHVEDSIPDVRAFAMKVTEGLAEVLQELLEKNPDLRIQTPEELIRRLRQSALHSAHSSADAVPTQGAPGSAGSFSAKGTTPRSAGPEDTAVPGTYSRPERSAGPAGGGALPDRRAAGGARRLSRRPSGARSVAAGSRAGGGTSRRGAGLRSGGHGRFDSSRRGDSTLRERAAFRKRGTTDDDEADSRYAVRRSRGYPFTIGGAVVGLAIGLALVLMRARDAQKIPEQEAKVVEEAKVTHLDSRKRAFASEVEAKRKKVQEYLARLHSMPAQNRRDFLFEVLREQCTNPSGYALAKSLLDLEKAGAGETGTGGSEGGASGDPEADYRKGLAEAETLYAEGRLGDAHDRLLALDGDARFRAAHGAEIDAKIEQWAGEIGQRWERDQQRIEDLAAEGEYDKAIEICRDAIRYGDDRLRREAEREIERLERRREMKSTAGESEAATEDVEPVDLESQFDDLRGARDRSEDARPAGGGSIGDDAEL